MARISVADCKTTENKSGDERMSEGNTRALDKHHSVFAIEFLNLPEFADSQPECRARCQFYPTHCALCTVHCAPCVLHVFETHHYRHDTLTKFGH